MPEQYPIPSYAVTLWVAGDDLWLAFPSTVADGRGHSVKLPASTAGLKTAIEILKARAVAPDYRLGNRGTPTQYELEQDKKYGAILEAMRADSEDRREARAKAAAELADLGL